MCIIAINQDPKAVGTLEIKIASIPVNSTTLSILQLMYFSVK